MKYDFNLPDTALLNHIPALALVELQRRFLANASTSGGPVHNPSVAQWSSLIEMLTTLDDIVQGRAERLVYVASCDPGIGKTTALIAYLSTLLQQDHEPYSDCGVLVAMNTLDEVSRFITEVGLPQEYVGVWTSRDDLNRLGRPDRENARVLLTTHERVSMELKDSELWSAEKLHYKGSIRRLRCWDEAYLPGHPISLNVDDVLSVLKALRSISVGLRNDIKNAFDIVEGLPTGTVHQLPDYLGDHDVSLNDVLEVAQAIDPRDEVSKKLNDAQSEIMTGIALVSGKCVKVRSDGRYGNASVDYHDTMPVDLAPILVMDASARQGVRITYEDMEISRGLVKRLTPAPKSYRNLTIHAWQRGGGKSAWQRNGRTLLKGIAATVRSKPQEEWLIVHHKEGRGVPNIPAKLKQLLPEDVFAKLSFTTWGRHRAVNKFSHIHNIILAGTLFLRPSQYEARKRLAAGMKPDRGDFTDVEMRDFELGESKNDILQAACRGGVRISDGDSCPPTELYIIASPRSRINSALPVIFPDCKLKKWEPVQVSLAGNAARAFETIKAWVKTARPGHVFKFTEISKQINVTKREFKEIRRWNNAFRDRVAALDVEEWGANVYFTGYRTLAN